MKHQTGKMQKSSLLPRISVTRPVSVTMSLVALLVLGAMAYVRIPVKMFPSGFTRPFLYVRINYPNSTPRESEQQIARPLEEALKMVKGVAQVRTYSGTNGVRAPINFRQGVDMDLAYNLLSDQLERLKPQLPEEARDNVTVYKFNPDNFSTMWVSITVPEGVPDPYGYLETHVLNPLKRVDGVGNVNVYGAEEKVVMVEVDQARLSARGVGMAELVQTLQSDNFALAGGFVREGGKKFFVRSLARYQDLNQIRNLTIPTGLADVPLKEIAEVVYASPPDRRIERIEGVNAMSVGIFAESGANIVEVSGRVSQALDELARNPLNSGVSYQILRDQGKEIKNQVSNLQSTALWGGLFAAMILFFYLRTFRMTAIITLSIPLCMMMTIVAMYFIGWSLNVITMMGLMVGVGLVVDNAIVILENIYRFRADGEAPRQASILGASEVGLAISMATLTTVVVFLPLMVMSGGNATFFMTRIGLPVVVALLGSLFVALIFIPLAAERFGGSGLRSDPRSIQWTRNVYLRMLRWVLARRRDAVLVILAILMTVSYPMGKIKRSGGGGDQDLDIQMGTPKDFSLDDTLDMIKEVEGFMQDRREHYGIRLLRSRINKYEGRIELYLNDDPNMAWWYFAYQKLCVALGYNVSGRMSMDEVAADLDKNIPRFVGVRTRIQGIRNTDGGNNPRVSVRLRGDDVDVLANLSNEVERRVRSLPSVVSVDTDLERGADEVRVRVDRERAQRYGISPQVVGRTIAFALQGVSLPRFQTETREVQTRLYLKESDRQTLQQLRNFSLTSSDGESVPVIELATVEYAQGSGTIRRENGRSTLRVTAFTTRQDRKGIYADIDRILEGLELPRGYTWDKGESYRELQEEDSTMFFAGLMAITCVFLLMGVLFESFILPFSVLLSIPFALWGVYWTLYLTDTPMNIMAMIGIIVLIGVVVNNAIVLVDMVNRLRADGKTREQAIFEAGANRFRPIMMTTLTTVFGLLPMALGNSNMFGMPYYPMGRAMMGGLVSSTLLTLLVVPLFYTFFDDLRLALAGYAKGAFTKPVEDVIQVAADD
jgi:HAE1 family hydrophobic/amphiphilic exporter-1